MRTDDSDSQREASAEENNKRILTDLSATAKLRPVIDTDCTPEVAIDAGLHEIISGKPYDIAPDNEPVCCQTRVEATETNAAMLEELPPYPSHFDMINELDDQTELPEDDLPILPAAEIPNDPKANPCT